MAFLRNNQEPRTSTSRVSIARVAIAKHTEALGLRMFSSAVKAEDNAKYNLVLTTIKTYAKGQKELDLNTIDFKAFAKKTLGSIYYDVEEYIERVEIEDLMSYA